jgi:regulation of enolase protein 1 (concanavalin A-like superfamily)/phosphatidylserine/phosphatidylglycerophosphate/cardiolipin synthase-like enzyme
MCSSPAGFLATLVCAAFVFLPGSARAADRLCDTAFENCRAPLLDLIRAETVGIDVAFWFMEDTRYANELIKRHQAGVPVRVLMDTRAFSQYGYNTARVPVDMMRDAGIPIRTKSTGGILHWKMMLFAGQHVLEFSAANFSPEAFVPINPYINYVDEVIYFTDRDSIIGSFKTRYDDVWTSTSGYTNYANVTSLQRHYPTYAIDPTLNFVPWQNFRSRSLGRYRAETQRIDSIMYRITDRAHTDEMIATVARGVPVRLIAEPLEYRNVNRYWVSWNLDRMYLGGIELRFRHHEGMTHEKLTLMHGQGLAVFGSSNWTTASASYQLEHNLFTTDTAHFTWFRDHFNRKWNNTGPSPETKPFVPLPPNTPSLKSPANASTGQAQSLTLSWNAGPWAHKYDVFIGTSPTAMTKVLDDRELGPSPSSSSRINWTVSGLAAGTTYYWKVIGRTMANLQRESAVWSFTTAGTAGTEPPPTAPLPSGWSNGDIGAVAAAGSASYDGTRFTVRGSGADIWSSSDEFHFAYRTLTGDGVVQARVSSLTGADPWTKAGVMIRESLAANSRHAMMVVSAGNGLAFQRRVATGGTSTHTAGGAGTAPRWVKLARSGSVVTASTSTDGTSWATVGSATISMASTVYVGLAITSHNDGALATATFDGVAFPTGGVTEPPPPTTSLPTGWQNGDIGGVAVAGSSGYSNGVFTLNGSGADIWSSVDEFQFAYQAMSGDGAITARIATLENVNAWTKAGVMMRESLTSNSRHASMFVTPANGLAFQRRVTTGGVSTHTSGGAGAAPRWVRLVRSGNTFSAYVSTDGAAWTLVGTDTITMAASIYVGLPITSHSDGSVATATADNVSVTP